MPRTALPVITTAVAGVTVPAATAVDATNGNSFPNTGREQIQITNGGGAPITITFKAQFTYNTGGVSYPAADVVRTLAAGATKVYGPFDKQFFNDGSGSVGVDFSAGTSVTAQVFSLGLG
jgi:hypothetical protein